MEKVCPRCKGKLVEIAYSYPSEKMWDMVEKKEIVLGGCVITGNDPQFQCIECGYQI